MNEFLQRLKQRKLVQWTLAYVAAAFALLQGIDIVASRFGMIAYIHAVSGETAQARAVLQELTARSAQGYVPPVALANVYMGLGERDAGFACLEKAYQDHDVFLSFVKVDPKWDAFRSDPRFVSILKRIGL